MPQHNRQKFICAPPRRQMCPKRIVHKRGTNASGRLWAKRGDARVSFGRLGRSKNSRRRSSQNSGASPRRLSSVSRFSTCRVAGRRSRANAFELWLQLRPDQFDSKPGANLGSLRLGSLEAFRPEVRDWRLRSRSGRTSREGCISFSELRPPTGQGCSTSDRNKHTAAGSPVQGLILWPPHLQKSPVAKSPTLDADSRERRIP